MLRSFSNYLFLNLYRIYNIIGKNLINIHWKFFQINIFKMITFSTKFLFLNLYFFVKCGISSKRYLDLVWAGVISQNWTKIIIIQYLPCLIAVGERISVVGLSRGCSLVESVFRVSESLHCRLVKSEKTFNSVCCVKSEVIRLLNWYFKITQTSRWSRVNFTNGTNDFVKLE